MVPLIYQRARFGLGNTGLWGFPLISRLVHLITLAGHLPLLSVNKVHITAHEFVFSMAESNRWRAAGCQLPHSIRSWGLHPP